MEQSNNGPENLGIGRYGIQSKLNGDHLVVVFHEDVELPPNLLETNFYNRPKYLEFVRADYDIQKKEALISILSVPEGSERRGTGTFMTRLVIDYLEENYKPEIYQATIVNSNVIDIFQKIFEENEYFPQYESRDARIAYENPQKAKDALNSKEVDYVQSFSRKPIK